MKFIKGKKTYILGALGLITIAGYYFGIISVDTANLLLPIFGFGGLITLRAAVAK